MGVAPAAKQFTDIMGYLPVMQLMPWSFDWFQGGTAGSPSIAPRAAVAGAESTAAVATTQTSTK